MRVPKQKHNASSKQAPHHSVVGASDRQPGKSPQQSPLVQTLSRVGNAGNHAALLNRAPGSQQSANKNLLLHLQRQYGNGYVNQVVNQAQHNNSASTQQAPIQTKLTIGPVGDKYEREADRTAAAVVQQINAPSAVQSLGGQAIQREKMPEEEVQKKPQISAIQREVMSGEDEQQAQMKPAVKLVQMKKPDEEDKQKQAGKKTALAAPPQPKKIKEEKKKKLLRKKAESNPSKAKKQEEDDKLKHLQKKSDAIAEHGQKEEDEDKLPVQKKSHPDAASTKKPEEEDKLKHLQKKSDTHAEHGHKEEDEDKLPVQKKSHPDADPHKKLEEDDDKHLMQAKSDVGAGHGDKDEEDKMAQMQPLVQRRSGEGGTDATADVESSIKHARGKGRPLPDPVRSSMENAFGADFSGVKIHADIHADNLNRSIQARAFTTGQDVFFRHGEFALGSKRGQELLAHELTHVVQQNGSAVQPKSFTKQEKNKENKLQSKTKFNESAEPAAIPEQKAQAGSTHLAPIAAPADTSGQEDLQQQPLEPEAGIGEIEIQRREAAGDTAPDSPEADPGYQEVVSQAQGVGTKEKEHQPAEEKSQEAQEAAEPPSNEVESKAQDKQVDEMEQAPTPPFDPAAFKKALMDKIKDAAPKNLEEADKFKDSNKLESVKNDVTGKVDDAQKDSQAPLEEKTKATPDTSGIIPKPVTPLPPNQPGETPSINGAEKAAPKSKGQSEVEAPAQARSQSLDQQLAGADITEEQLAKSNEPQFQSALDSKKTAQTHSQTAPQAYRQGEQSQLSQAESAAAGTAQEKLQGIHGERSQSLEQVTGKQEEGKGKDEQSRTKIAGDIGGIYDATKKKVDDRLKTLTQDVTDAFDAGAAEAKKGFEEYVGKRMDAYKADRYTTSWSNPFGWAKWVNDQLWGMPEEVNRFYEEGRDLYIKNMDGVIDKVVAIVGTGLTEAKNDVADGRKQVKEYVAKLPEDLKEIGVEAAENIQTQFDGLEQEIDSKQDELIDTLAQKYKENLDAINARIKEMQEENKGLIIKAIEFIVGVIKTIIELAKMLFQVLMRVASVIGSILKDPIGFLGNLFNALKLGFNNFVKNIGKHLMQGLLSWLTGALAGANIQMPTSLDSQGIFSLVIQVLGVGYDAIRAKAVKRLGKDGEEKVSSLEKSFEMFRILATQGVAGVWQVIKDRLGDFKSMVLDPIMKFLIENVISAGVQWIIGLMSPASAFIKACKAIYDIVKFFIEHAQQIADLINSILDAIALVASGAIDKAAQAVEDSLAKAIPVAIGFLASILGLGGISEKVQSIIQKMRQPIDKAIDWVIDQGMKAYKKVSDKFKKSKLGKKVSAAKKKAKQKLKAAKQWGKNKQKAAKDWFDKKKGAVKDKFGKGKASKNKTNKGKDIQIEEQIEQQQEAELAKATEAAQKVLDDWKIPLKDVEKHLLSIESKHKGISIKLVVDNKATEATTVHAECNIKPKEASTKVVQRREINGDTSYFPEENLEVSIERAQGNGKPLDDSIRYPMEQGFETDFSEVKVHTDSQADQLNQSVQAKAFTTEQDIFFRQGAYDPASRKGQELIAHELTHVMQQSNLEISNPRTNRVIQRAQANIADAVNKRKGQPVLKGRRESRTDKSLFINKTKVTFEKGMLNVPVLGTPQSETVGKKMEGIIGPDHPAGSSPDQEACKNAIQHLKTLNATQTYIRGHLLNGDLGGPGTQENLYPITSEANSRHYTNAEKQVKEWVNEKFAYVYYKVEVTNINPNNFDATLECEAYPITHDPLKKRGTIEVQAQGAAKIDVKIESKLAGGGNVVKSPAHSGTSLGQGTTEDSKIVGDIEYQGGKAKAGWKAIDSVLANDLRDLAVYAVTNSLYESLTSCLRLKWKCNEKMVEAVIDTVNSGYLVPPNQLDKGSWTTLVNKINKTNLNSVETMLKQKYAAKSSGFVRSHGKRKSRPAQRYRPY